MSSIDFDLHAEPREEAGTRAMRRLRRDGQIPGVVYGAGNETVAIQLSHSQVLRHLEQEAFYSHILTLHLDGKKEQVILRHVQRHPVRVEILHLDLLRIKQDAKIRMTVPFHFVGEEIAPGVKQQSGLISHLMTEAEVICLPSKLPEFIEVDVSELNIGEPIHLSNLTLPEGVELVELTHEHDHAVVIINVRREIIEEELEEEGEVEGEGAEDAEGDEKAADPDSPDKEA